MTSNVYLVQIKRNIYTWTHLNDCTNFTNSMEIYISCICLSICKYALKAKISFHKLVQRLDLQKMSEQNRITGCLQKYYMNDNMVSGYDKKKKTQNITILVTFFMCMIYWQESSLLYSKMWQVWIHVHSIFVGVAQHMVNCSHLRLFTPVVKNTVPQPSKVGHS